jgi:hypothetical protein
MNTKQIEAFNKLVHILDIQDTNGKYLRTGREVAKIMKKTPSAVYANRKEHGQTLDKHAAYLVAQKKIPQLLQALCGNTEDTDV